METEPEPDEMWLATSYTRNGIIEQFVLFLEAEVEYIYPDYPKHEYKSPEVAWPGW